MYEELVKRLRERAAWINFPHHGEEYPSEDATMMRKAADAIEELLKTAKSMHTWIFLNTGDEQKAYDECGLSDEMNAMLGYGGQFEFRAEPPKEET